MNAVTPIRRVRILFDETHNESWSTSREKAKQMSPGYPEYSSYQSAADLLSQRDFWVERNLDRALTTSCLNTVDIVALLHPCDPRWERTVSQTSPRLNVEELHDLQQFVKEGGALLVVTEYEHEKYGDNLNELLHPFGLTIQNTTVLDRMHCVGGNPAWILGQATPSRRSSALTSGTQSICFYQAGSCLATEPAEIVMESSGSSTPPHSGLLAIAEYGRGRVVVVTDSLLFGDDYFTAPAHQRLWLNICYWLAVPAFQRSNAPKPIGPLASATGWSKLKHAVNALRTIQQSNGAVSAAQQILADGYFEEILGALLSVAPLVSHQGEYLEALRLDLQRWKASGFGKPDFSASLRAFCPQRQRRDGIEHLVLFPLYTPNASLETRFEALIVRVPWPDWLATLERTTYRNEKFAPGHLIDCTAGYHSECAVLFPETVSVESRPSNQFATIFCDREAKRLQAYATRAIEAVGLATPPALECWLQSLPIMEDTVALWDLIHDRSHSLGELPFDPFMIRQRAPFWMYALEELRVDLRSFGEAIRLATEGSVRAHFVPYAITLDRLFRFPIVGTRVKNYDGLAGQLLFAFLHEKNVITWCDNILNLDWESLPKAIDELRREIALLYRQGATCSKLSFWIAAHDLVARYVRPNVASRWKKDSRAIDSESEPAKWIALVQDDEFPLGNFHLNLRRRLGEVRWLEDLSPI